MTEKRFRWTCGGLFTVKLTPKGHVIQIYIVNGSGYRYSSHTVAQVKRLARNEWIPSVHTLRTLTLSTWIALDQAEADSMTRCAQRVLNHLGIEWKKR